MDNTKPKEIIAFENKILEDAKRLNINPISFYYRKKKVKKRVRDFFGFRLILDSKETCLFFGKFILEHYEVVQNRYRDYISKPWKDGYQSIHIDLTFQLIPVELQLRTEEMEKISENLKKKKGEYYWRTEKELK